MLLMESDLRLMEGSNSRSATSGVARHLISSSLSFLIRRMGMLIAFNSQGSCKCSIKAAISILGSIQSLPSSRSHCEPPWSLLTLQALLSSPCH